MSFGPDSAFSGNIAGRTGDYNGPLEPGVRYDTVGLVVSPVRDPMIVGISGQVSTMVPDMSLNTLNTSPQHLRCRLVMKE